MRGLGLTLGIAMLASLLIFADPFSRESDQDFSLRIQQDLQRIPEISFPKTDANGRAIPRFDKLVVFPPCSSCSNFVQKMFPVVRNDGFSNYLLVTESKDQLRDYAFLTHCFIIVKPLSQLDRRIQQPGVYYR